MSSPVGLTSFWIGCHADKPALAELFGDDIAVRGPSYQVDWRGAPFAVMLLRHSGSDNG
jgi:hypothetical protein